MWRLELPVWESKGKKKQLNTCKQTKALPGCPAYRLSSNGCALYGPAGLEGVKVCVRTFVFKKRDEEELRQGLDKLIKI